MSRRYWLTAIAVVFSVSLAVLYFWHQVKIYQVEKTEQRQSVAIAEARSVYNCFSRSEINVLIQCLYEVTQFDAEAERSNYDLQAQQEMALWAYALLFVSIVGTAVSAIGLAALLYSLELNRQATAAAINASDQARVANDLLRDQQRPWVTIRPIPAQVLTYEAGSNTLMLGVEINHENVGESPAMDLAVNGKIKILPKYEKTFLDVADWLDLRKEVAADAVKDSSERRFTETVFAGSPHALGGRRYFHAHLNEISLDDGAQIALAICVSISYKVPSGQGGAVWHGIICRADPRNMFSDFIAAAKNGPVSVYVAEQPVIYY